MLFSTFLPSISMTRRAAKQAKSIMCQLMDLYRRKLVATQAEDVELAGVWRCYV